MLTLIRYIHLNPVIHGFVNKPEEWKFSSYNSINCGKPSKVLRDEVINYFGDISNFKYCHNEKNINRLADELDF